MKWMCVLVVTVALVALPGTATANREHQQIMAEIRILQEQTAQLQLMLNSLTEALRLVVTRLDDQAGATRKAFADHKLLVDSLADGVRILREKVDDTNVRLSSLAQELVGLRMAMPAMMTQVPGPEAEPGAEPNGEVPAAAPAPLAPGMAPSQLYDLAYADFAAGEWSMAIAGFETYIKSFPRTPQAASAQFYIGQSYYADGRFREAAAAFDRLIADYPEAPEVPEGYYKRGIALERLGQIDAARQSFEHVLRAYSGSNAAMLARQALDRINRIRE